MIEPWYLWRLEEYYGHMKLQTLPLCQAPDSTITHFRWEVYKIVTRANNLEDLKIMNEYYKKEDWFIKVRYIRDLCIANRFRVMEIIPN